MIRDLVIDMSDFMDKLQEIKPWIIRSEDKLSRTASICSRRMSESLSAIQHVHQLHDLLLGLPCLWT